MMFELILLAPVVQIESLSDALEALDALSVSVEDADAHTPAEQALFGEPGMPPPQAGWERSRMVALFATEALALDAAAVLQPQDFFAGCQLVAIKPVPEQDWVRLTQSQFTPVEITPEFWIVPTWHEPPAQARQVIRLDPGLAFGTGTHPTTRMCLRWIAGQGTTGITSAKSAHSEGQLQENTAPSGGSKPYEAGNVGATILKAGLGRASSPPSPIGKRSNSGLEEANPFSTSMGASSPSPLAQAGAVEPASPGHRRSAPSGGSEPREAGSVGAHFLGRVLDYGCGSGILAIGAAKFGALEVDAVDIDGAAVETTRANAQANQVQLHAGLPDQAVGTYQTVLANILATPLRVLAPLLCGHVQKGGYLVLAGILDRQADELKAAYAPYCQLEVQDAQEGWILMVAQL